MLTLLFIFCIIAVIVGLLVSGNKSEYKESNTYFLVEAVKSRFGSLSKQIRTYGSRLNGWF